jgi:hypothetical protein
MRRGKYTKLYFDVSGEEPEKVYHAFSLGMLVSLSETHEVRANRESGYGRYDVMLIAKTSDGKGIIIEFKKVNEEKKETLKSAAEKALEQIESKNYETEIEDRGIKDIIKMGIAFKGKEVLILN